MVGDVPVQTGATEPLALAIFLLGVGEDICAMSQLLYQYYLCHLPPLMLWVKVEASPRFVLIFVGCKSKIEDSQ